MSVVVVSLCPADEQSDIAATNRSLQEIRRHIKEKRSEHERLSATERATREELSRIAKKLSLLQDKARRIARELTVAQRRLSVSERVLSAAQKTQQFCRERLEFSQRVWQRCALADGAYSQAHSFMLAKAVRAVHGEYTGARVHTNESLSAVRRWDADRRRFLALQSRLAANARDQESVRQRKSDLLATTTGRRVTAEEEIGKLRDESKALQELIRKLERSRSSARAQAGSIRVNHPRNWPWPVEGHVTISFGKSTHPELKTVMISNGVRIAARSLAEVRSPAPGTVVFSGPFRSYGTMVVIDHGEAIYTIYGQLGATAVSERTTVDKGALVGTLPDSREPHLYFEIRLDGQPQNPSEWLIPPQGAGT